MRTCEILFHLLQSNKESSAFAFLNYLFDNENQTTMDAETLRNSFRIISLIKKLIIDILKQFYILKQ